MPVAQRLARRNEGQGVGHGRARSHHHLRMVPGACAAIPRRRARAVDPVGQRDRLCQRSHVHHLHPGRPVGTRRGDERVAKSHARRLGQPPRGVGHLSDLAAEAHLAEHDQIGRQGPVGHRRGQGQRQGQVGGGLEHPDAADGRGEDVGARHRHPGPLLEHGQQQRQATAVDALGRAPARGLRRRSAT